MEGPFQVAAEVPFVVAIDICCPSSVALTDRKNNKSREENPTATRRLVPGAAGGDDDPPGSPALHDLLDKTFMGTLDGDLLDECSEQEEPRPCRGGRSLLRTRLISGAVPVLSLLLTAACMSEGPSDTRAAPLMVSPQWSPYMGPPPLEWHLKGRRAMFKTLAGGVWNIALGSDFPETRVWAEWTYIPTGEVFDRYFPLSYWVSALTLDNDGLGFSVAGKRKNGNNVLDHYRFNPPPVPGSGGGGSNAGATSVTNLYDDVREGQDLICALEYVSDTHHNEYVAEFYFSREVSRLSRNGSGGIDIHLMASPDIGSHAPHYLPSLSARPFFHFDVLRHRTLGTVMIAMSFIKGQHTHVVSDTDMDGIPDGVVAIHSSDWGASPYSSGADYLDYE